MFQYSIYAKKVSNILVLVLYNHSFVYTFIILLEIMSLK